MFVQSINFYNSNKELQQANHNTDFTQNFGLKLRAPLKRDTVSFGMQTPKDIANPKQLAEKIPTRELQKICGLADAESKKIKLYLDITFNDMIYSLENQNGVIEKIKARPKSVESLLSKIRTLNLGGIKTSDIPKNIFDLCGAKFVMYNTSIKACDSVIEKIRSEIEKGNLILEEIENKRPVAVNKYRAKSKARAQYDYGSEKVLLSLYDTAKKIDPNADIKLDLDDISKSSNYMAIHIRLRLKNGKLPFELQIMGSDVSDYKDLDDLLYKLLSNKPIKDKYNPIKKIIDNLKVYDDNFKEQKDLYTKLIQVLENAPTLSTEDLLKLKELKTQLDRMGDSPIEKFNNYRADAFLFQRDREPQNYTNGYRERAPLPRSKYVFTNNTELNKQLDLEELYLLMQKCNNA